jgi:alanine-glyoxylate transaminase/serine-glyoxylate transaminase/serine-pyruvate transaminase
MMSPGDKVLVCENGVFGKRMTENVERCGGKAIIVSDEWGKPVDLNKVDEAFKKHKDIKILAFVHAETSTGVRSDAAGLSKIAQKYNALTIMDAVTSLAGIPVLIDEWNIDACYSGSQKCLSCTPGLSPITFSERVVELLKKKKTKSQSWFMDLNLLINYWGDAARTYHHTAPTNSLYSLHESLIMLKEEGIENTWLRHLRNYKALKAGLETLCLRCKQHSFEEVYFLH